MILCLSYFISWPFSLCSLCSCFSLTSVKVLCNIHCLVLISANSITDVINVKFFIILSCICFLFFLFVLISLFPTIMFLNKFFSLNLLDNHSLSLVFNLVIFLLFIFQGFFLRSITFLFFTFYWSLCTFYSELFELGLESFFNLLIRTFPFLLSLLSYPSSFHPYPYYLHYPFLSLLSYPIRPLYLLLSPSLYLLSYHTPSLYTLANVLMFMLILLVDFD